MREEDSNWFSKWEEELPSPEELTPLSQTLITPDLALAFDIPNHHPHNHNPFHHHHNHRPIQFHHHQNNLNHNHNHSPIPAPTPPPVGSNSGELESSSAEMGPAGGGGGGGVGGGGGSEEPARTLKRPRLVWTPQLHKRFVDAVAHLGIKNAVPKTIMQLMSVDGLTRENVASHLQKYRLYLKRMQGHPGAGGPTVPGGGDGDDSATDRLFASGPVPPHFLNGGGGGGGRGSLDNFGPYLAPPPPPPPVQVVAGFQQPMMTTAGGNYQNHYHDHNRQMGQQQFGLGQQQVGHFDHQFLSRGGGHRIGTRMSNGGGGGIGHGSLDDVENGTANGRKVLTLFPTGE